MTTTQTISNVTVKVTTQETCPSHIAQQFKNLEAAVNYMKENDVIYKSIRMGEQMVTLSIEKTEQANENEYENMMKVTPKHHNPTPNLPTDMWK